jgi:signal transduction histidine kinase
MNQSAASFITFISIATGGLILIAFIIILFVIFYQRKMFAKKNQLNQLTIENQKQLLEAVLTTKETEQKRIAQELHDEIGSSVNSIKMYLHSIPLEEQVKQKLTDDLVHVSKNIRRISNDLMPAVLEELGLIAALKYLCKKLLS